MALWDQLKERAKDMQAQAQTQVGKFKNKDFANASMAMCALIAAADRGVEVRVVLDSFGCRWMSDEVRRRLNRSDCRIAWFRKFNWWLPFNNHRTHRKLSLIHISEPTRPY